MSPSEVGAGAEDRMAEAVNVYTAPEAATRPVAVYGRLRLQT